MKHETTYESTRSFRIAVVQWAEDDGIAEVISNELAQLGHHPIYFKSNEAVPAPVDVVFTFGPYGRFLRIPGQFGNQPAEKRPTMIHWNTENPPDLRLPWFMTKQISAWRSWIDRLNDSGNDNIRVWATKPPLSWIQRRMNKFRYVGEYHYAHQKGWLDLLIESSKIYANLFYHSGLPTKFVPWGTARDWYETLNLKRDIDVIWMGKWRRTRRRKKLLTRIRSQLVTHGVEMYVADNIENPFIYGDERTQILNRAKITLNVLPTWDDNAFPYRFQMAAPNRSLVVSDPILPHCPIYEAGTHYVSAPVDEIADTILYYLKNEAERREIVENAYQLVTTQLTFANSIKTIMSAVDDIRAKRSG